MMRSKRRHNDDWLDAELRAVAVPRRLARRLRRIAVLPPEQIDRQLRQPAMPSRLAERLAAIPARRRWRPGRAMVRQWAVMASFLGALWLGYAGAVFQLAACASGRSATLPGRWTPISQMLPPASANLPAAPPNAS